jgi:hypothetical protein
MTERKLVKFDMTRADIPPLDGHDWTSETPNAISMAHENLRVVCERHPGQFQQVLSLACQMMEKANPGMLAAIADEELDGDGHMIACTVYPIPA